MGRGLAPRAARPPRELAGLRAEGETENGRPWSISCFYVYQGSGAAASAPRCSTRQSPARWSTPGRQSRRYPVQAGSVDPYTGYDTMFADAGFELVRAGRARSSALASSSVVRDQTATIPSGNGTASRARRG